MKFNVIKTTLLISLLLAAQSVTAEQVRVIYAGTLLAVKT